MLRRAGSLLAALALTVAGVVADARPAQARPSKCAKFVPQRPLEDNGGRPRPESLKAPVIAVNEKATKSHPITRTFEHGRGLAFPFRGWPLGYGPEIIDEHKYFNFQVTSRRPSQGLYVRIDWPPSSLSDIDLNLYDARRRWVGGSESFNNDTADAAFELIFEPISGGPGYELIEGVRAPACAGFMLDSQGSLTLGEKVRLTVWLGVVS
jgi:hypothetical protein